jgi:hypothetical protein
MQHCWTEFGTRRLKRFQRDCESSEKKYPLSVLHGGGLGQISRQSGTRRRRKIFCVKHNIYHFMLKCKLKSKGIPRLTEVVLGVLGRLRPQIVTTFDTTRVVGRQPNVPANFTPGEIPDTHFQRLSRPWFCRKEPRKKIPNDTTGDRSRDRPTSSAVL